MKLQVTADGSSIGTTVTDESGQPVDNVIAVRFEHRAGKSPTVEVDISLSQAGLLGEGKVYFRDREVRRIIYADGGEEEF